MNNDDGRFSVAAARAASERGELAGWVAEFLASPGSDNPVLAELLPGELRWWAGPVQLPLNQLQRLAGPPNDPVLCPVDDEYWDERVDAMDELAGQGWEPPPVVVSCRSDQLVLEDGNHRVEGLRRAGLQAAWAVVGFQSQKDRDRFAEGRTAPL